MARKRNSLGVISRSSPHPRAQPPDVPRQERGYDARMDRPSPAPRDGVSVSPAQERSPGHPGYRFSGATQGHLRPWLLLASPRRMRDDHHPQDPSRLLAGKVRGQQGAGPAQVSETRRHGLGISRRLGMRNPSQGRSEA